MLGLHLGLGQGLSTQVLSVRVLELKIEGKVEETAHFSRLSCEIKRRLSGMTIRRGADDNGAVE